MDKQWVWGGIGGQERMHRVDKMDAEGNSQEGKLEIWMEEVLGWGLGSCGGRSGWVDKGRKDHGFEFGMI